MRQGMSRPRVPESDALGANHASPAPIPSMATADKSRALRFRPLVLLRFLTSKYLSPRAAYPSRAMSDSKFERFDELLILIVERSGDDELFADMKLNKLLFYCDIEAYRRLGRTISRSRYQHLEHGPGSVWLNRARERLAQAGALEVKRRRMFNQTGRVTVAKRKARTQVFSPEELAVVTDVLQRFRSYNGTQIAELSHDEPGWKMTSEGEDIPFESALIQRRPSEQAIERGQELAKQFGW